MWPPRDATRPQPGSAAVIEIVGGLDLGTLGRWAIEVERAAAASPTVVLDLSQVDFLDSAGVHALFRMLGPLAEQGKRALVVAPRGGRVRRLLEILELTRLAWICETREEALRVSAVA
jgi:anti-anti-sigma factor